MVCDVFECDENSVEDILFIRILFSVVVGIINGIVFLFVLV